MKLIAGLGNKGNEYKRTPHNAGFEVVDMLAEKYNLVFRKAKKDALYIETIIDNEKVVIIKPLTYMNNSGDSVFAYAQKYKIDIKDILVIVDDIELTPGLVRSRVAGSGGTHNGLKNVCMRLGSNDFARIRVGVGEPMENQDLADFVLSKMSQEKYDLVKIGMEKAVKLADDFIHGNVIATTE